MDVLLNCANFIVISGVRGDNSSAQGSEHYSRAKGTRPAI